MNDAHFIFTPDGNLASVFGRFLDREDQPKKKKFNVHLPRQRLREMLLSELLKGENQNTSIKWKELLLWNHSFESYKNVEDALCVTLCNGASSELFEIRTKVLVGADGIHSRVRKELTRTLQMDDFPLVYLGMIVVLGMTPSDHSLNDRSTWQMLDGSTRLFTMPYTVNPNVTFW